jgi:hypothetical protein
MVQAWRWYLQAPTGRANPAQANGLGFKDQAMSQALKGRANTCRKSFADSRFIPTDRLNIGFVERPFRAISANLFC